MIKLGTNSIGTLYLGSTKIGKAYLGSNLVYSSSFVPRLPSGYTEVIYIENTSNAYLNTGISGNGTTWNLTAQNTSASANGILVGRATSAANWFGVSYSTSGNTWAYTTVPATTNATIVVTFSSKQLNGEVNGVAISRTGTSTSSNTYRLFDYSGSYPFKGKIFGDIVATKSTGEVFRGVPCKNSSNVVGLYDLVSERFITPVRGSFVAGPNRI